ncbi:GGDEF domain-containing protein [Desulfoluna sp.]|uniref:GGDEF domain-containing protein n=1 Tax=Desulfoluna sp. TaxID=2045199 RepID=UPI002623F603|nr:GGDEF domain-containing protein [Desulfoluna sp.]
MGDLRFTWVGEFADRETESAYRGSFWPEMVRGLSRICVLLALGFLLGGFALPVEQGWGPTVRVLSCLRGVTAAMGLVPLMLLARGHVLRRVPGVMAFFILCVGACESITSVFIHRPWAGNSIPFTLLFVFLFYFVAPLAWRYILAAAGLISVLCLAILTLWGGRTWADLFPLILLLCVVNGLGFALFIQMARWRRQRFFEMEAIQRSNESLRRDVEERNEINRHLEHLAITDSLTGVGNRRKFLEVAEMERRRACRYGVFFSLVMLDIDYFKKVNDRYGHEGGDIALCELTRVVEKQLRCSDLLVRLGGEEFAILLPETRQDEAWMLAERVRQQVAAHVIHTGVLRFSLTVSMGVTEVQIDQEDSVKGMLNRADAALYKAKSRGRNRVEIYRVDR